MRLESKAPVQVELPGASVKADLWANTSGAFVRHSSEQPRAEQPFDVCMRCGEWSAVAGYSFYWYWEDTLRGSFVPLCKDCDEQERIRIEHNRRRRRR